MVFTENPPTTPVQRTFVSAVPGQSQQVVLPISTETVVQVDGSCEFSGCQPETSSDPAFGLPSQEGRVNPYTINHSSSCTFIGRGYCTYLSLNRERKSMITCLCLFYCWVPEVKFQEGNLCSSKD